MTASESPSRESGAHMCGCSNTLYRMRSSGVHSGGSATLVSRSDGSGPLPSLPLPEAAASSPSLVSSLWLQWRLWSLSPAPLSSSPVSPSVPLALSSASLLPSSSPSCGSRGSRVGGGDSSCLLAAEALREPSVPISTSSPHAPPSSDEPESSATPSTGSGSTSLPLRPTLLACMGEPSLKVVVAAPASAAAGGGDREPSPADPSESPPFNSNTLGSSACTSSAPPVSDMAGGGVWSGDATATENSQQERPPKSACNAHPREVSCMIFPSSTRPHPGRHCTKRTTHGCDQTRQGDVSSGSNKPENKDVEPLGV